MRTKRKIDIRKWDRFKPQLYADLYIPSWVNGYSIGMEFVYNWFLSKFPQNYFKTIHIVGKHPFDDFRRFERGEYAKREKPAVSFAGNIQYEYDSENVDIHLVGIDSYIKKTDYYRSFFKDPQRKMYIGQVPEIMLINFTIRTRFSSRAEQLDMYKRMEIMFRIGCTETFDTDINFHVPYELMVDVAHDAGFAIDNGIILNPYDFLTYLNSKSQIPFVYQLRYINAKHEFFIRLNNVPLHLDMRNKLEVDEGEQEGQISNNYHIDMNIAARVPVPKFYLYYAEGKDRNSVHVLPSTGVAVYSMKVLSIPEVNSRGWIEYGRSNYIKEKGDKYTKEIDIKTLFTAPVDIKVDISLADLIEDSIKSGVSPSSFIDIKVFTNDMMANGGEIPIKMDWDNMKIILPDRVVNSFFYIIIYTDRLYINSKIIDIDNVYKNRIRISKKSHIDRSQDNFDYNTVREEQKKNPMEG